MPDRPKRSRAAAPGTPTGSVTRLRILDTAEQLFAEQGPAAVTLRSIAAAADVNVAAVNYHFGSKGKLFEEMFLRRVGPLNEARLDRLAACVAAANGAPVVAAIVTAYVEPAMQLADSPDANGRAIIVQYSLGRVLALPEINKLLIRYYDKIRNEFVGALRKAAPHLAEREVVWRYYWMGGCTMVSLAVPPGMVEAGRNATSRRPDTHKSIAAELIAFLVQGFAPAAAEHVNDSPRLHLAAMQ